MRVLFVIHQLDYADHIAVAYLSGIANQLGHKPFFCSLEGHDLVKTIALLEPHVVAYSANVLGYPYIVRAHNQAKKVSSFVSIMGGPQATYSPETFDESGMDAYCRGEGEYAFRDFLNRVAEKMPFDDIPNLITRNAENPLRPLIRDLDELPQADRDLTLANSYLRNVPKKTFYATRGCPYSCTYCCNNFYNRLYRGKGPIVRRFSVERVVQEMEGVKAKYRMDFVKMGDDLFAMRADDWLEEFSEKYPRRIGVPFNCFLRLDIVDDSMLRLLKQAGCFSVDLSIDSTSEFVREKILQRRGQGKNKDLIEKLRLIRSYGINTWVNFMLAAPESTLQDDLDTIEVGRAGKVTYVAYSTTEPMQGTELYDYCIRKGYLNPDTHKGDMTGCSQPSTLNCFSPYEKRVRFNVYLLGALIAKLAFPLNKLALLLIKVIPPNPVFWWVRSRLYKYYIENKIFLLRENSGNIWEYLRPKVPQAARPGDDPGEGATPGAGQLRDPQT